MALNRLVCALTGAIVLASGSGASAQEKIMVGFLPGVVDPFYQVMQTRRRARRRPTSASRS